MSSAAPVPTTADRLAGEQAYLARARAELARMREHALGLDATRAGGGALATEYLRAALHRRALALLDDPETPLFFGRLDAAESGERSYVGRRHVRDAQGDPLVVDWRADIALPFYRATRAEPMGVALRRRFGYERGRITAYEDEHLLDANERDRRSAILAAEIERPRVGPMRDIVATVQPEQDEIVRADLDESVCVQGAPGTGKTAVGLHRAAYLLYAHRQRLRRGGVLVVGPNAAFLAYIAQVLPALGEVDVTQVTVEQLVGSVPVRGVDDLNTAAIKGDARMATVLRRAVWSRVRRPAAALVLPRGSRRWRLPAYRIAELVDDLVARDVRYEAGRRMLAQRIAHELLCQFEAAGDAPDDRVQTAVARSRPVRAYVDAVWPKLDPKAVLRQLRTDAAFLAAAADRILDDDEQRRLLEPTGRALRWSAADAVLLDELADLLDRQPSVGHVVLDEAQDLSPMQLRAVGRRATTGSMTVLGDLAQGTTPWASGSWAETLNHLGKPAARVAVLRRGYRVPALVVDFAGRLLPRIAPAVAPPEPVRENPGLLSLVPAADLTAATVAAVREALTRPGSVGLVVPDAAVPAVRRALQAAAVPHGDLVVDPGAILDDAPTERLTLVPATLAKGLEFDSVVVVEPAAIAAAEPRGLRRLYVVLTRAVSALTVVHAEPLPEPLAG